MRKLLYFLIGFVTIQAIFIHFTYAYDTCRSGPPTPHDYLGGRTNISFDGNIADGFQEWHTNVRAAGYNDCRYSTSYYWGGTTYSVNFCSKGPYINSETRYMYSWNVCPPLADSDNDGLPDDCDQYPEDSTPYNVQIFGYQTSDGSFDGPKVRATYQTDRGDMYTIGADYDSSKPSILVGQGAWTDPADHCNLLDGGQGSSTGLNSNDNNVGTSAGNSPSNIATGGDGTSNSDSDDTFRDGTDPDGTETAAEQKIIQNTSDTASNVKDLTKYMKDLNTGVANLNKTLLANGQWLTGAEGEGEGEGEGDGEDQQQAEDGLTDMDGVDVNSHYGSDKFSSEITEGVDYDEQKLLSEETWLTDFVSNNPVSDALENSGFSTSNSTCTLSADLGRFGTVDVSWCQYEDIFDTAGAVLLGIVSLMSLVMVVRG